MNEGEFQGLTPEYWETALTTLERWRAEAVALEHPFLIEKFELGLGPALQ